MGGRILKLINSIKCGFVFCLLMSISIFTSKSYSNEEIQFDRPITRRITLGANHYWVLLPNSFQLHKQYPIVIYLHGRKYGPVNADRAKLHLDTSWFKNSSVLNYIVAFPALPITSYPTWTLRDNPFIESVIQDVRRRFKQKISPLFLAGFSAGALHSLYTGLNRMFSIDGIIAFAYGLIDQRSPYLQADRSIPIFLAVGRFDYGVRANVLYSLNRLKRLSFSDVSYREYPIGHWVHDQFIKDLHKWVETRAAKILLNRELAIRNQLESRRNTP